MQEEFWKMLVHRLLYLSQRVKIEHKMETYATLLVNHRLAISCEYSFLHLEPVALPIRFWFDGVNSAQEHNGWFSREELGISNILVMASLGYLA